MEELRKKERKRKIIVTGVILLAVVLIVGLVELLLSKTRMQGPFVFESLKPDEIRPNIIVDVTIDTNFGSYMEEYEIYYGGIEHTLSLYYVIWTGDVYAENYKYMGIKVPADQESTMEEIVQATYEGDYAGSVSYTGVINKMNNEEYQYFQEYFQEAGWTEKEIEENTLPYFINVGAQKEKGDSKIYFMFIVVGVAILILFKASGAGSGIK